jgi:hypothetical protein
MSEFEGRPIGAECWMVTGGHIPLRSTGREPEFTSRDELSILNTNRGRACLSITIYYTDREPVGPYELVVKPRTTRRVRFNDLIFPEALALGVDYAAMIRSDVPVVVQFTRLDSAASEKSWACGVAYPETEAGSL